MAGSGKSAPRQPGDEEGPGDQQEEEEEEEVDEEEEAHAGRVMETWPTTLDVLDVYRLYGVDYPLEALEAARSEPARRKTIFSEVEDCSLLVAHCVNLVVRGPHWLRHKMRYHRWRRPGHLEPRHVKTRFNQVRRTAAALRAWNNLNRTLIGTWGAVHGKADAEVEEEWSKLQQQG